MTEQTLLPPIGVTINIEIPITRDGQKFIAKIRATGEPGVSAEDLERCVRESHAAIERGEYEPVDIEDIDGHLTQRNLVDIIA